MSENSDVDLVNSALNDRSITDNSLEQNNDIAWQQRQRLLSWGIFEPDSDRDQTDLEKYDFRINTSDIYATTQYKFRCFLEENPTVPVYGAAIGVNITVDCTDPTLYKPKEGPELEDYLFRGEDFYEVKNNTFDPSAYILPPHPVCELHNCSLDLYKKFENTTQVAKITGGNHSELYTITYDTVEPFPTMAYSYLHCTIEGGLNLTSPPIRSGISEDPLETYSDFLWTIHVDENTCVVADLRDNRIYNQICEKVDESYQVKKWSYNTKLGLIYLSVNGKKLDY